MVDLDPAIWQNPTLGEGNRLPFLDEEEAQARENYAAKLEGRTPRTAVHHPRKHEFTPSHTVPSDVKQVVYVDADGDGIQDELTFTDDGVEFKKGKKK